MKNNMKNKMKNMKIQMNKKMKNFCINEAKQDDWNKIIEKFEGVYGE